MTRIFGPGTIFVLILFLIAVVVLWLLTIFWSYNDAKSRGFNPIFAAAISIFPFLGVLAYILIRPQFVLDDKKDIELDIALKNRLSQKYGVCSKCGCAIEEDYLICPNCQSAVREKCKKCGKAINIEWRACPFCSTPKTFNDSLTSYDIEDIDKNDESLIKSSLKDDSTNKKNTKAGHSDISKDNKKDNNNSKKHKLSNNQKVSKK